MMSLGKKIQRLRREKGWTQEELASQLGVSAQAVSKWETDVSSPDISLLRSLAEALGTSVDQLLSPEDAAPVVQMARPEQKKKMEEMVFHIRVSEVNGDKVNLNLPMPLVQMALEMGMAMPKFGKEMKTSLQREDVERILQLVEKGAVGKLLEVQSANGDFVEIVVE